MPLECSAATQPLPAAIGFAFADKNQREMGQRRQVPAGPYGTLRRDDRVNSPVQHLQQQEGNLGTST